MKIRIAKEIKPFIGGALILTAVLAGLAYFLGMPLTLKWVLGIGAFLCGFMVFFFRDPVRKISCGEGEFLSGADGLVRSVEEIEESRFMNTKTVRISVFLSVFNVHVNRAPMAGKITNFQYTPGKRLFAFLNDASEYNENNAILIEGENTRCLVRQIVGPVARRVVCWFKPGAELEKGQRFGIMKFGSRLDVYFPSDQVEVKVKKGEKVIAGETVLATLKK